MIPRSGVRSTQVCADTEVYYYLNVLDPVGLGPSLIGSPGFDSLREYGIMPWWAVAASATAYPIMNPNGKRCSAQHHYYRGIWFCQLYELVRWQRFL